MLVVDTSAFISLAIAGSLEPTLTEFDVVTTQLILDELGQTATYDDRHGDGAAAVIDSKERITVVEGGGEQFVTSRIDAGEASCIAAVREIGAAFLITDDFRALPEVQGLVDAEVTLSPIVLRALVKRGALSDDEATAACQRPRVG